MIRLKLTQSDPFSNAVMDDACGNSRLIVGNRYGDHRNAESEAFQSRIHPSMSNAQVRSPQQFQLRCVLHDKHIGWE